MTLDDGATLRAARSDPAHFIERRGLLGIDEFQLGGPELLRAIKASVDRHPRKGRFLLAGSTRFLTVPNLSESLAGRVILVELAPLTQGERRRRPSRLAEALFADPRSLRSLHLSAVAREDYVEALVRGGFPEAQRLGAVHRRAWFESYARTVIERDAGQLAKTQDPSELTRLLRVLAARTAQELNLSDVSRDLAMARTTVEEHARLLENVYLWHRLPSWSGNLSQRVIRHPKAYLTDVGLAAHLRGDATPALVTPGNGSIGPLLETLVAGELVRQRAWSGVAYEVFHYRDAKGVEVDFVLEAADRKVCLVEVKASSSLDETAVRRLGRLRERLGTRLAHAVLLYLGHEAHSLGDRLTALPISAFWARKSGA